jgi:class 3 adenylate cyclase
LSIRWKLLLAFTLLAAAVLLLALVAARQAVRQAATEGIEEALGATVEQSQRFIEIYSGAIEDAAAADLDKPFFVEALGKANASDAALGLGDDASDEEGLQDAHDLIASADMRLKRNEVLVFANAQGKLVFTAADEEAFGMGLRGIRVIDEALAGRPATDLWSDAEAKRFPAKFAPPDAHDDLFLVLARRIERGNKVLGALVAGFRVKDRLLPDLERLARARVALVARDGSLAATQPGADLMVKGVKPGERPTSLPMAGRNYLVQAKGLRGTGGAEIGSAVLMRDFDAEIRPILSRFQQALAVIVLGVLALAFGGSIFGAGRFARPLIALEAAARKVRRGDLTVEVPAVGRDEVGRLAGAFNEMVAGLRQRDQIKGLFKRYLNPAVVDELIKHPEKASPGGERRTLTVLFSDLVGFTTMSEGLSPEALVAILNEYFEETTHAIAARGATLDKFIGDAIMCFWNAPLPQEDHAARACLAALDLLAVVDRLAPKFQERGAGRINCRIGINTGPCVVGNIGASDAQDYTVIGDTVNLASRLEGAAKVYGTRSLVTAETIESARGAVLARELDLLRVKGKNLPVRVFELVAPAGNGAPSHLQRFADGLGLYRAGKFSAALAAFESSPDDPPSRIFAERCREFLAAPPPEDWGGVHALDSK